MSVAWDVIVAGSGNAGFSAALSARERGARVLIVDKAPDPWLGGNSYFTAGAMRTTHGGTADLLSFIDPPDADQFARTDLRPYTDAQFRDDMRRLTNDRCDPELAGMLIEESAAAIAWLHDKGQRFRLMYDRQSFEVDGRFQFWGGLALGTVGGGKGLIARHREAAHREGITVLAGTPVTGILRDGAGAVAGVRAGGRDLSAGAVVLAAGGFEADPRRRAQYLGPNWDVAKVRGTPFNTGEVLMLALAEGAQACGHWSGCHAVSWDASAPATGDLQATNLYSRDSYPIGLLVNRDGRRFVDEGADFRNYTYAKYGAEILRQPGAVAYQLFDAQSAPLLRQEQYRSPRASRHEAPAIGDLARAIGVDAPTLESTVARFNRACSRDAFNPAVKDGKRAADLMPPKSNWALPLEKPPFLAYPVTCAVTFTFGGLRIDADARVTDSSGRPIPGLHAAGEMVGGLFYHNYPGGTGLTSGTVIGRRAGRSAAAFAS